MAVLILEILSWEKTYVEVSYNDVVSDEMYAQKQILRKSPSVQKSDISLFANGSLRYIFRTKDATNYFNEWQADL